MNYPAKLNGHMLLHNRVNKEELKKRLSEEVFNRKTISFYRYFKIDDPQEYRDELYMKWSALNCFGRIKYCALKHNHHSRSKIYNRIGIRQES